jgi:hypothetical protein
MNNSKQLENKAKFFDAYFLPNMGVKGALTNYGATGSINYNHKLLWFLLAIRSVSSNSKSHLTNKGFLL